MCLGAAYKAVEFHGDRIARLRIPDRFTLCSMMAETGRNALMPCDMATEEYLGRGMQERVASDEGRSMPVAVDVSSLEPMVALLTAPTTLVPLSQVSGLPVGMAC